MDSLMLGLSTTLVGMLVVFGGLIVLIACIYALTSLTGRRKKAPAPQPEAATPVPVAEAPAPEADAESDEQLIAVITAAIAAVWQGEGSGFIVRRVKRCQSSTLRARAARDEQIYSRL